MRWDALSLELEAGWLDPPADRLANLSASGARPCEPSDAHYRVAAAGAPAVATWAPLLARVQSGGVKLPGRPTERAPIVWDE